MLIATQVLAGLICAAVLAAWQGGAAALAGLAGSGAALVNAIMIARRLAAARRQPADEPGRELGRLYRASFGRFVAVLALLGLLMGLTGLAPAYVLTGFVVGQVVLTATSIYAFQG